MENKAWRAVSEQADVIECLAHEAAIFLHPPDMGRSLNRHDKGEGEALWRLRGEKFKRRSVDEVANKKSSGVWESGCAGRNRG